MEAATPEQRNEILNNEAKAGREAAPILPILQSYSNARYSQLFNLWLGGQVPQEELMMHRARFAEVQHLVQTISDAVQGGQMAEEQLEKDGNAK